MNIFNKRLIVVASAAVLFGLVTIATQNFNPISLGLFVVGFILGTFWADKTPQIVYETKFVEKIVEVEKESSNIEEEMEAKLNTAETPVKVKKTSSKKTKNTESK